MCFRHLGIELRVYARKLVGSKGSGWHLSSTGLNSSWRWSLQGRQKCLDEPCREVLDANDEFNGDVRKKGDRDVPCSAKNLTSRP